jgi:hypothetical protein
VTASRLPRELDDLRDGGYEHDQQVPSTVWTITHNLHRHPLVIVYDTAGTQVIGSVEYLSADVIRLTFSAAFAGVANLI